MRILHIGPLTSQHTQIAALAYRSLGYEVIFLNTRTDTSLAEIPGIPGEFVVNPWSSIPKRKNFRTGSSLFSAMRSAVCYCGAINTVYRRALCDIRSRYTIDVVVATWGVPVLEAVLAAQKILPGVPVIYNILTVPEIPPRLFGWRGQLWIAFLSLYQCFQNRAFNRALRSCSVRVYCGQVMKDYLVARIQGNPAGKDVVRVERFPVAYFAKVNLKKLSLADGELHIAHIGATNYSGQSIDDVSSWLLSLTSEGINVHFNATSDTLPVELCDCRYLHVFEKFGSDTIGSEFSTFLTQFDALVILYNVTVSHSRFENSLPTRFLFALIVGIPIFVPRGLFLACEEYIIEFGIGAAFDSPSHLKALLSDTQFMTLAGGRAKSHARKCSFEATIDEFRDIFRLVTPNQKITVSNNKE